jgi:DNA-binding XRE family transcriptional regulator
MTIGQSIRKARERKRYTQEDLAKKIGVSRQQVINWEADKANPSLIYFIAIADEFHLSLDALIGRVAKKMKEHRWTYDRDPDEINLCLHCTKKTCSGNCSFLSEYRKRRKA